MPKKSTTGAPTVAPPETKGNGSTALSVPQDLDEQLLAAASQGLTGAMPSLEPPQVALAAGTVGEAATAATGTWLSDKRVGALWSINQLRNSWAYITGVGWKKLYNTSDSSITAMTMLASHARQTNSRFDYREEADQMIHEIYVW